MSQRWRKWLQPSLHHIQSVKVLYDPLDGAASGTKEFYFQVLNRKLNRTNPKCTVALNLVDDRSPPLVEFTYKNGTLFKLLTASKSVDQITFEMSIQTAHLENTAGLGEEDDMNDDEDPSQK